MTIYAVRTYQEYEGILDEIFALTEEIAIREKEKLIKQLPMYSIQRDIRIEPVEVLEA
jgi:hypothetical protein